MYLLGNYIKNIRESLQKKHSGFSGREVAKRMGMHYSYLSKLERGDYAPMTEKRIHALARELGESPDLLMVLGGKVSTRIARLIRNSPDKFLQFIHSLELEQVGHEENSTIKALEHRQKELIGLARHQHDQIKKGHALERDLAREKEEKQAILDNLKNIAIELIDVDFNLIWANSELQNHYINPTTQAGSVKCFQATHGRTEPCPNCVALKALQSRQVEEGTFVSRDGRHWLVRSVPIVDDVGNVEKIVHFGVDATQMIQAEQVLKESKLQWETALERAGAGIWEWDTKTNMVNFSTRWKEMLGFANDEIGKDFSEWDARIHPDDYEMVHTKLNRYFNGDAPSYECEHRLRCKDGSYKWLLTWGVVVERDAAGTPSRVIGTHLDIAETKSKTR